MANARPSIDQLDLFHERTCSDGRVMVYGIDAQNRSWNIARDTVHELLVEYPVNPSTDGLIASDPIWMGQEEVMPPEEAQEALIIQTSMNINRERRQLSDHKNNKLHKRVGRFISSIFSGDALTVEAGSVPDPQISRWQQLRKSANDTSWTAFGVMVAGASKAVVYGKEKLSSKKPQFHDYTKSPEKERTKAGAALVVLIGVAAISLATKYGLDLDMPFKGNDTIDKPEAGGDSMFDNLITDIQQNAQDALDNIPDTVPSIPDQPTVPEAPTVPDLPDTPEPGNEQVFPTGRNLSSGQSYWTESIDYARDLGYDLDQQDRQDLLTIDAIKDEVLRLNQANGDPNSLPVGTDVRMPSADKVHNLYKKYH